MPYEPRKIHPKRQATGITVIAIEDICTNRGEKQPMLLVSSIVNSSQQRYGNGTRKVRQKTGPRKTIRQRLLPMTRRKYVQRRKEERNRPQTQDKGISRCENGKKEKKEKKLKPHEKLNVVTPHAPQMK